MILANADFTLIPVKYLSFVIKRGFQIFFEPIQLYFELTDLGVKLILRKFIVSGFLFAAIRGKTLRLQR